MLEHKGIPFRRFDLVAGFSRLILRAAGFPDVTVPAILLDGMHLQGTRTISRALDALRPERALFPRDPERRAAVEQAEGWGDEVLQPVPRRLAWAALRRDPSAIASLLEGARLGIPTSVAARTAAPVILLGSRLNRANDETVRADLARLSQLLDRVDGFIEEGTVGGGERNAADYQLAPSVRLLMTFEDLEPLLADRPATRLAREVVPRFPGRFSRVFPAAWLPG